MKSFGIGAASQPQPSSGNEEFDPAKNYADNGTADGAVDPVPSTNDAGGGGGGVGGYGDFSDYNAFGPDNGGPVADNFGIDPNGYGTDVNSYGADASNYGADSNGYVADANGFGGAADAGFSSFLGPNTDFSFFQSSVCHQH